MRDSSCIFNESDAWCHPTLCRRKMELEDAHENNLEHIGYDDLSQYVDMEFDVAYNRTEQCGYKKTSNNYIFSLRQVPTDIILPEPLESFDLACKLKKQWLQKKIKSLEKELSQYKKELEKC